MAGCDKADRNRKSNANVAYKAGNRQEVNAKRKQAKHVANSQSIATKNLRVTDGTGDRTPKGTRRANLRATWMAAKGTAEVPTFQDWKKTARV